MAVKTKGPLWAESWRCGQQAQRVPPPEPRGLRQCWGWTPGPSSQAVLKGPQGPFQEMDVPEHTVLWAACSSRSSQSCLPSSISSLASGPRIRSACYPSRPLTRALISLGQELGLGWLRRSPCHCWCPFSLWAWPGWTADDPASLLRSEHCPDNSLAPLPSLGPGDTYRAQMSGQTEPGLCQDVLKANVARRGTEPERRPERAVSARQESQSLGLRQAGCPKCSSEFPCSSPKWSQTFFEVGSSKELKQTPRIGSLILLGARLRP